MGLACVGLGMCGASGDRDVWVVAEEARDTVCVDESCDGGRFVFEGVWEEGEAALACAIDEGFGVASSVFEEISVRPDADGDGCGAVELLVGWDV